jgi:2'-5' RNA ligase
VLVALDVAVLPPPHVRQLAVDLSAALPASESHGLQLDDTHIPHITLTQLFVRDDELDTAFQKIDEVVRVRPPLHLTATGGGRGSQHSVWIAIESSPFLQRLHEDLMAALRGLERPGGTHHAFWGQDARIADVLWVTGYRLKNSFGEFSPHITLGHAEKPPDVAPLSFTADTIAACHLGRFCACREIRRLWTLS